MTKSTFILMLIGISLILCTSCQPSQKDGEAVAATSDKGTEVVNDTIPPHNLPYAAIGNAYISQLYAETKSVDIIFYDLPISVNQDDEGAAKNTALFVSPTNPKITADCKPIGRLSWIANGKILREADVYMEQGCEYFMFMENNEGVAVNAMSPAGVEFFKKIISKADQKPK